MPTLEELCERAGGIQPDQVEQLHGLLAVWQLLADTSFADLLLLAPMQDSDDHDLLVLAQIRPDSVPSLYQDDHVGTALLAQHSPQALACMTTGRQERGGPDSRGVQRSAVPVRSPTGKPFAVILREGTPFGGRRVSALEQAYVQC